MTRVRRFVDVLNWTAVVAPGVILCKDGRLLAGWRVTGIDTESLEPDALAGRLRHLSFALSGLGDPHTLWSVFRRRSWSRADSGGTLPETGNPALDALAVEASALLGAPGVTWTDTLDLFLCWKGHGSPDGLTGLIGDFEAECSRTAARFGSVIGLSRLLPDREGRCSLCAALADLLLPGRTVPPVRGHALPLGIDAVVGADVVQPSRSGPLLVDGRPAALLAVDGLPGQYPIAPFEHFQDIARPFSWITRYDALSPASTRRVARTIQRFWRQSAADFAADLAGEGGGRRGRFEDAMAEGVEATIARASLGDEGHGRYLSLFLLHAPEPGGEDSLAKLTAAIMETAGDRRIVLREERGNAIPALLSALPGHCRANARNVVLRARAMADFMPVRGTWQGMDHCPSPHLPAGTPALLPARARTGQAFHFNLHHAEVGHTLIFGPTGAGKSVLLGLLASAWLRYPEAQVIYFDRQRSIRHACNAIGGRFLEPGAGAGEGIAPLSHVAELGAAWASDWLAELVRRSGVDHCTAGQAAELRNAVTSLGRSRSPCLRDVRDFVQDEELRRALDTWLEGPHSGVFDQDGLDLGDGSRSGPGHAFTVFETHPLLEATPTVTVLSLDYIFAQVSRRFDGRPTLVVLDEAWSFFAHGMFEDRIRSWLKEGRKSNVAVVMATQSVADAAGARITVDLLESCPTKIFMPNPEAETSVSAPHYTSLGLAPSQTALVAAIQPKRDLYVVQPDGRRVVSFPLGPAALSILGRTSAGDSARAAERAAADPDYWKGDLSDALAA